MLTTHYTSALKAVLYLVFIHFFSTAYSQSSDYRDKISIQSSPAGGNVHLLYCVEGFGGGNVAASIGEDGILLVDNVYSWMSPKLEAALKSLSAKPVRIILNTHFHRDHIESNTVWKKSSVIIAHKNVSRQLLKKSKEPTFNAEIVPAISFTDSLLINFNGEEIHIVHFPNCHTDGDAMIYFTRSKVVHLGDMFFFGMFPAVYTEGGGDILQLIRTLEKITTQLPADVKVIPGHGQLASLRDLSVEMLKKTTDIVASGIRQGKSLQQMKEEKVLAAYEALGTGGAQTTDQYLAMLHKLLLPAK